MRRMEQMVERRLAIGMLAGLNKQVGDFRSVVLFLDVVVVVVVADQLVGRRFLILHVGLVAASSSGIRFADAVNLLDGRAAREQIVVALERFIITVTLCARFHLLLVAEGGAAD